MVRREVLWRVRLGLPILSVFFGKVRLKCYSEGAFVDCQDFTSHYHKTWHTKLKSKLKNISDPVSPTSYRMPIWGFWNCSLSRRHDCCYVYAFFITSLCTASSLVWLAQRLS